MPIVNLSLPKFSCDAKTDLLEEAFPKLGITDVLDPGAADFSPLLGDDAKNGGFFLTKGEQAAIVEVNEDGVVGAAYTEFAVEEAAEEITPEIVDFTIDRPFCFFVVAEDGSILFTGKVLDLKSNQ